MKNKLQPAIFLLAMSLMIAGIFSVPSHSQSQMGGGGSGTTVTGTSPIVVSAGAASCPTCVTSAASTTTGELIAGVGSQGVAAQFWLATGGTNQLSIGGVGDGNAVLSLLGTTSGQVNITAPSTAGTTTNPLSLSNAISVPYYQTATKCAAVGTTATPSVATCAAAAAGVFSCNDTTNGLCQVNTTALINANSSVVLIPDESTLTGTLLSVTCNTTASLLIPAITAKVAATSFTVKITAPSTNPACYQYYIVN